MKSEYGLQLIKKKEKYLIEKYGMADDYIEKSVGELLIEISDIPSVELYEYFLNMEYQHHDACANCQEEDYSYVSSILVPTFEDVCEILRGKCSAMQAHLIRNDLYCFLFNYLSASPLFEQGTHYYGTSMRLYEFELKDGTAPEYSVPYIVQTYFREYLLNTVPVAQGVLDNIASTGNSGQLPDRKNYVSDNMDAFRYYDEGMQKQHIAYLLDYKDNQYVSIYNIKTLDAVMAFELANLAESNILIKKCENCGKFFIPFLRADAKYCDRKSPQKRGKTCKQYAREEGWYTNLIEDEVRKLSRTIDSAKAMLVRRNPDNSKYAEALAKFRQKNKQWKNDLKNAVKTESEYKEWLLQAKKERF